MSRSSSEDESDDSTVIDIEDFKDEINTLTSQINNGCNSYENYEKLIKIYSKCGEIDFLRKYREEMSKVYPISPDLWIHWIKDEKQCAINLEQKLSLEKLFTRAFDDYQSISLWLEYCSLALSLINEDNEFEVINIRKIFDKAITNFGHHFHDGHNLFAMYRDFEKSLLSTFKEDDDESILKQINMIMNIYKRQTAIPSIVYEELIEEYKIFLVNTKPYTNIDSISEEEQIIITKTKVKNKYILKNENNLKESQDPSEYVKYFNDLVKLYAEDDVPKTAKKLIELKENTKFTIDIDDIISFAERMILKFFSEPSVWNSILSFIEIYLWYDIPKGISYCNRAIRNLPKNLNAWLLLIHVKEYDVLQKLDLASLSDLPNIWDEIIDTQMKMIENFWGCPSELMTISSNLIGFYTRRCMEMNQGLDELEEKCSKGRNKMNNKREIIVSKRNAFKDLQHLKTKVHEIFEFYENLVEKSLKGNEIAPVLFYSWKQLAKLEAIHFKEVQNSFEYHTKILKTKGHTSQDWLDCIEHVSRFGNLSDLTKTLSLAINSLNLEGPAESIDVFQRLENFITFQSGLPVNFICLYKGKIKKRLSTLKVDSNKRAPGKNPDEKVIPEKKRPKFDTKKSGEIQETKQEFKVPNIPASKDEIVRNIVKHDPTKNNVSVFLSNLSFTATEEDIRKFFTEVGKIVNVRLVRDFSGKSKGYAYLEFSHEDEAKKALGYDRNKLIESDPRPMFVSRCDPNRDKKFSFAEDKCEKNKLFIKGLSKQTSEETLKEFFSKSEGFKQVRLVTLRNGHSKGFAYAEYENEDYASKAMKFFDGKSIDDSVISVMLSNPPAKNTGKYLPDSKAKDSFDKGPVKKQCLFLPRAISKSAKIEETTTPTETICTQKKTNADFKAMFLNKS